MNDTQNGIIPALMGLGTGFMIAKGLSSNENTTPASSLDLQTSINTALLNSIKYEDTIKKLQEQLNATVNSGPTNDFLKLQLKDLQENYTALMTYVRSKVPELPTSFVVNETPVTGLHFAPNLVFDRDKTDRNISIVNDVITLKGVTTYKVPIRVREGGIFTELRSQFNPTLRDYLANITTAPYGFQIRIGDNERQVLNRGASMLEPVEPLCLIEFDRNVDLSLLLNNIVIGSARNVDGTRWDLHQQSFIALYRKNILAFKVTGHLDVNQTFLLNLVLRTLVNSQQLMIKSATVVDSMSAGLAVYAGADANHMTPSYKLVGKSTDFKG